MRLVGVAVPSGLLSGEQAGETGEHDDEQWQGGSGGNTNAQCWIFGSNTLSAQYRISDTVSDPKSDPPAIPFDPERPSRVFVGRRGCRRPSEFEGVAGEYIRRWWRVANHPVGTRMAPAVVAEAKGDAGEDRSAPTEVANRQRCPEMIGACHQVIVDEH